MTLTLVPKRVSGVLQNYWVTDPLGTVNNMELEILGNEFLRDGLYYQRFHFHLHDNFDDYKLLDTIGKWKETLIKPERIQIIGLFVYTIQTQEDVFYCVYEPSNKYYVYKMIEREYLKLIEQLHEHAHKDTKIYLLFDKPMFDLGVEESDTEQLLTELQNIKDVLTKMSFDIYATQVLPTQPMPQDAKPEQPNQPEQPHSDIILPTVMPNIKDLKL